MPLSDVEKKPSLQLMLGFSSHLLIKGSVERSLLPSAIYLIFARNMP